MKVHRIQLLAGVALGACIVATPLLAEDAQQGEIVVTAQHREQALTKVPSSISVVSGAKLEQQQLHSLMDLQQLVAGMSVTQTQPGLARIVLRGLNTGSVTSAVAVYVDDIPFGSSGGLTGAAEMAGDFDTFDIARVEVLRGPQGTLYGANSLGGVLKYITALPSTARVEAKAQAGIESIAGGKLGWLANGMFNLPINYKIAVRASGFYHRQGGYNDSVGTTGNNINSLDSYGGRASILLKPTERLTLRLSVIAQQLENSGNTAFTADPATLRPFNARTGANSDDRSFYELYPEHSRLAYRLYSGTADWDFGPAKLTSVTSYGTQTKHTITDVSFVSLRPTINAIYAPTAPNTIGMAFQNDVSVKKFTQELRLASTGGGVFDWTVGGYYTREKTLLTQQYLPFTLATQTLLPLPVTFLGQQLPQFYLGTIAANYREIAGFASGTLHLGDRFDITAGGRYSHNSQDSHQHVFAIGAISDFYGKSSENVFTWSVAPRFELTKNASLYARIAKGYRPGGPNFIPAGAPANFPASYHSDTVVSYEAGLRAETSDHLLSIDAAAFYVDWKNIQIVSIFVTPSGPTGTNANGQRARSQGLELTATARPMRGLTFIASGAYTKAKLRDDTVPSGGGTNVTGGLAGDQLPYAPKWSGTLSGDYDWSLSDTTTAFVGGNVHRQSSQPASFSAAYRAAFGRQIILPGYTTVDLRAGITMGRYSLTGYVHNLLNNLATIAATSYPNAIPAAIGGTGRAFIVGNSLQPRTIGVLFGVKF
jgi:iron complex outermembrane receptor protein